MTMRSVIMLIGMAVAAVPARTNPSMTVESWGSKIHDGEAKWTLTAPRILEETNNSGTPTAALLDISRGGEAGMGGEVRVTFTDDNDYAGIIFADHRQNTGSRRFLFVSFTNRGDDDMTNDTFSLLDVAIAPDTSQDVFGEWLKSFQGSTAPARLPPGLSVDVLWKLVGGDCTYDIGEPYTVLVTMHKVFNLIDGQATEVSLKIEAPSQRIICDEQGLRIPPMSSGQVGVYSLSQRLKVEF